MQVFSTFLKIAKKQLKSTLVYLVVFILIMVMMTRSGNEEKGSYSATKCNLVIIDMDKSAASEKLVQYLSGIHAVQADSDLTDEQIQDYLYYGKINYVLYIEKGYETTGALTNIKQPGTATGAFVDNQIGMYERSMNALLATGYSYDEAYELTLKSLDCEDLVTFAASGGKKPLIYSFFGFLPYVTMMIVFFVLTPVLASFTKKELNDRMNVSPLTLRNKNTQIIAGTVLVCILVWLVFIILACLVGNTDDFKGMFAQILLNTLVFVIMAASMATILGNLGLTGALRDVAANVVGLGFSFLGGVFVPVELFGKGMLAIAKFMPTYWYICANDKIFSGGSLSDIAGYIGIEALFAAVFFLIAIVISKRMRMARSN